ncbi:hypothetical protein [Streptomyces sp. NPDC057694]|uniref:hypothetical protein n=1 Tax=Streptomyces sp. NPDC057694 TaxID=3346216 RepID=UPI0036746CC8
MRTILWGPAEFVGVPRQLMIRGLLAGSMMVAATVGLGFAGMWRGPASLDTRELGLVVVAALVLYLMALRAGRILIGLVAVLGICLAFQAPDVAAGVALEQRGLVKSARVASVASPPGQGRRICSLADLEVDRAGIQVWRGCVASIAPGDILPVVYDPRGRAPVRGVGAQGELRRTELRLMGTAAGLVAACTVAVVRTFRQTGIS